MPMNFFRLGRYPTLTVRVLEPSTWPEDFGVLTPNRGGPVNGFHWDRDLRALRNCQTVDQLAGFGADGFRERDDIIFIGLWNNAGCTVKGRERRRNVSADVPRG